MCWRLARRSNDVGTQTTPLSSQKYGVKVLAGSEREVVV